LPGSGLFAGEHWADEYGLEPKQLEDTGHSEPRAWACAAGRKESRKTEMMMARG